MSKQSEKLEEYWRNSTLEELEQTLDNLDQERYPDRASALAKFIHEKRSETEAISSESRPSKFSPRYTISHVWIWSNVGLAAMAALLPVFWNYFVSSINYSSFSELRIQYLIYLMLTIIAVPFSDIRPGSAWSYLIAVLSWSWFLFSVQVSGSYMQAFAGLVLFAFTFGRMHVAVKWYFDNRQRSRDM